MTAPSLPIDEIAAAVRARVGSRHFLLLCDFDGTLVEFDADPAAVRLPPARRALLAHFAGSSSATVAIVSGRRIDDVRARAALGDAAYYAGSHGLEIAGGGETFLHPAAAIARDTLLAIRRRIEPLLSERPGAFIEDKELSIVLHTRDASPTGRAESERLFLDAAGPAIGAGRIRSMRGACVIELMPDVDWDKGSAVRWIRERVERIHGPSVAMYVGDDVTDENAFRVLTPGDAAVACSARASGAQYRVAGPPDVERLLTALARGSSAEPSAR